MKILNIILFLTIFAFAETNTSSNVQNLNIDQTSRNELSKNDLIKRISDIDEAVKYNIWITKFANFISHKNLKDELNALSAQSNLEKDPQKLNEIQNKMATLSEQLLLLKEYENTPFSSILSMPEMGENIRVTNPFAVISGFSTIKNLQNLKISQKEKISNLKSLVEKLNEKEILLSNLIKIDPNQDNLRNFSDLKYEIGEFKSALEIASTTYGVFEKKADEQIAIISSDIKSQGKQLFNMAIWIISVIALAFLCKYIAKKYIKDNENFYLANKIINILNFTIIVLILLFSYIENMTHFITVLGFASAGLAIAMKDMFMSLLGWSIIVFGGSFRVGDRVKVQKNGIIYVGDIIDISVLRTTIYEDITYTTWKTNKRAGRIIFIPNNYIFTDLISNYTHSGMKTVWDGIDILITFDSNHKKAMYIIKNIVRKYSKGYTDIAKKQMSKLRNQYSIKNPNVEPRIFSFFEPYGIEISVWYMTNSYATLGLRSNISSEILEALRKEKDIKIAYPAMSLYNGAKHKIPDEINGYINAITPNLDDDA